MVITYSRVWINRVRLPILLVVSWTVKINISLSPFAPENLASRDGFGRPVPRQPAHSPYLDWIWCLLTGVFPIFAAASIYLYCYTPSGPSRVHQVKQLRTDHVHCRESAGIGPAVFRVVPVTVLSLQVTMDNYCAALFPHAPYWYDLGMLRVCTYFYGHHYISRIWINRVRLPILLVVS